MKLAVLALVGVGLTTVAARNANAELDAVELLFQDQPAATMTDRSMLPSIASNEPISSLVAPEAESELPQSVSLNDGRGSSNLADHGLWDATAAEHGVSTSAGTMTADHRSEAVGTTINAVPEPSAILLALAALVYFLLFGRRRRVV
jgi:PEP-CTERM motif